jgi:hypothetical protein
MAIRHDVLGIPPYRSGLASAPTASISGSCSSAAVITRPLTIIHDLCHPPLCALASIAPCSSATACTHHRQPTQAARRGRPAWAVGTTSTETSRHTQKTAGNAYRLHRLLERVHLHTHIQPPFARGLARLASHVLRQPTPT